MIIYQMMSTMHVDSPLLPFSLDVLDHRGSCRDILLPLSCEDRWLRRGGVEEGLQDNVEMRYGRMLGLMV